MRSSRGRRKPRARESERLSLAGRNRVEEGSAPPRRSDKYPSTSRIGDPGVDLPLEGTSENSVTANFAEFLFPVSRERPLRPTPIEPGIPEEGCPYRQVLCARHRDQSGGGLKASGRGKAKGRSFPAKLWPFTPLSERSCVYYSGTGPGGRQEKSRAALEGGYRQARLNDKIVTHCNTLTNLAYAANESFFT